MTSLVPLTNSIKRRRSRVSWMVECSPHITTSRGSSGSKAKARRSLSGLAPIKSDLDSLFDDIPIDGSPLPLKLIQDLNIASPAEAFFTPKQIRAKTITIGHVVDDTICSNLMSLLAQETPGREDPEEYHTPLPAEKYTNKDIFYTPSGSPQVKSPKSTNTDISIPFMNLTLKRRRTVVFADEQGDGSPIITTAPPSIRFPLEIEFDDEPQQPTNKKRKVDTSSSPKARLPSQRRSLKRAQDPMRRSRRLSQVVTKN